MASLSFVIKITTGESWSLQPRPTSEGCQDVTLCTWTGHSRHVLSLSPSSSVCTGWSETVWFPWWVALWLVSKWASIGGCWKSSRLRSDRQLTSMASDYGHLWFRTVAHLSSWNRTACHQRLWVLFSLLSIKVCGGECRSWAWEGPTAKATACASACASSLPWISCRWL